MISPAENRVSAAPDNIVLIGPMGAGKSAAARELAILTGRRSLDTDRLVCQDAGHSIVEIFAQYGEERFRELESAALRGLAGERRRIIATGGGIVTRPLNAALLRDLGCVVWLTASEDVLFERVSRNQRRPLLQTADPRARLTELLALRRPLYESCAHFQVDTTQLTHAAVAQEVFDHVQDFFASRELPLLPS